MFSSPSFSLPLWSAHTHHQSATESWKGSCSPWNISTNNTIHLVILWGIFIWDFFFFWMHVCHNKDSCKVLNCCLLRILKHRIFRLCGLLEWNCTQKNPQSKEDSVKLNLTAIRMSHQMLWMVPFGVGKELSSISVAEVIVLFCYSWRHFPKRVFTQRHLLGVFQMFSERMLMQAFSFPASEIPVINFEAWNLHSFWIQLQNYMEQHP